MKRPARLQSARKWLASYGGNHVVRSYARWFAVDLLCALKELQLLGVVVDPEYAEQLKTTLANRRGKPKGTPLDDPDYGSEWDSDFAFIAGYTAGGAPFGLTWEEMEVVPDFPEEAPPEDIGPWWLQAEE